MNALASVVPATGVAADTATWPLTEAQAGLWYAQRMAPDNAAFNTAHALWIEGALDVQAFAEAADRGVAEAQALSLRMRDGDEGPAQSIDASLLPTLQMVDLSHEADPQAAAREAMRRERLAAVDPARDRLALQQLYLLGTDARGHGHYAWYLRVHHLATDGYGMALLTERVCALYAAILGKTDTGLALAALDAALSEDLQYRSSERRVSDAAYWRETMAGMPAASGLGPGFAHAAQDCLRHVQAVEPALRARLHALAEAIGQPWPDVLTALTSAYCQRMSGVAEAVVGVPFMGRLGSASARVPAMVMNVLPLRVAAAEELDVQAYVQALSRSLVRGRRHGRYRGEQLRRDLGLLGGQRRLHGPLVNVQPFYRPPQLAGTQVTLEILATGPVDDVTLGFRGDTVAMLDLEVEANPALYTPAQLQAHGDRLLGFLASAFEVHARGGTMADIALATPDEAQRYLFEVNDTAHPVPETTLMALFEAQASATPEAPALEYEGETLSYAQLEQRTRALALQLRALGVGRESIVAVALPRSLELEIALVGVQRAGGAYLPLDLAHPDERIARILASAAPVCVLALADDAARFADARVLSPADWQSLDERSPAVLEDPARADDAAYVIYTSGSTGEPKGVLVEHRAIVNRLEWMRVHYGFAPGDRILQKTPATFDVSVWEFFLPLLSGATLVMAPPEAHRDPIALARLIRERAITTLHFVPSMLSAFLAVPASRGLQVQRVFCSGEELGADLRDRFHAAIVGELHNLYGPTEAAVDVSYWPASRDDRSLPVPIGFPVWNTRLYVLDARMRPLPAGVVGDLYLGGVQLARGYLGRDDLTAERFIADPFVAGARMYRTGDLARWREDGSVVFLGRSDHQVKLRGLRIELGEIEAALRAFPAVERGEVIVREDRPGDKRLVAYLQLRDAAAAESLDTHALRNHLLARIPDYMVPAAHVVLDAWPVTANGKLDRNRLPVPPLDAGQGVALQTDSEHAMAALFAQVLELDRPIGADADFFALGGDSLSAVHLLLAIQQRWSRDPGLGALFAAPTVAGLAALVDADDAGTDHGLAPMIRLVEGDPALAPVFVVHPAGGIAWNYRDLSRSLQPRRHVHGLQSPALDAAQPLPASIDALADDYARRAAAVQPEGPVHLVGWSVGGILAQAMAVRLQAMGRQVGVLALLDAYPSECWRAEPEPDPVAALRALLAIAGYDPEQYPDLDTRAKIVEFLRRGDSALGNLPDIVLDGVVRAVTDTNRLVRQHHHGRAAGTLLHLRAGNDHVARPQLQSALWAPYADTVEAVDLPFLHAQMSGRDAAARIAPLLDARLREWDLGQ